MFQVEHFERISQGNYRVVLTTDDPGALPMLRFLRGVAAFTETLHRRIDHERRILRLTDRAREQEPQARAERARILALYYRELPGRRGERLKALRRVLRDQYPRCGYDDVRVIVSLAVADERAFRRSRSRELAGEGLSCREIGRQLAISPAQASRLSGPRSGDARGCPTIDDLPCGSYPKADFPGARQAGPAAAVG